MSAHLALGSGGEFDRLRAIYALLGATATGLGDDCALVAIGGTTVALSIDVSIEDVHFRTDWLSYMEIGWRAAAGALSDLAADGAAPVGVLTSLGVPANRRAGGGDDAAEIMAGVGAAVQSVGGKVLGGDLVRSDRYIVDVCVVGAAERPVRRAGARPGEGLWVTGTLGGAALALRGWQSGRPPAGDLAARYARPEPRIAAGRWLAAHGATAMIDISDGLTGDAGHLAAASGVRCEIALERIPCWMGVEPLMAATSGEEYELLVALPAKFSDAQAQAFEQAVGLPLSRIGTCAQGQGVQFSDRGVAVSVPRSYDHFSDP